MEKTLAQVDPDVYDAYIGHYQFVDEPDYGILITRLGDRLFKQDLPDGRRVELWPESETKYFIVENGATMTFFWDATGSVNALKLGWGEKLIKISQY